ncbi:excinuclease ABC subunit A [Bacillus thuringiensis]|uniref:excinuclease ABC subunit UvrA n=1 Tax=Bacillus thuringiensis TaxID=1428 RepID=UPI000BF63DBB|nr:excinuclease ABC subunit UvrA [Bacillus thuringiensis]PEV50783.1 excinuclease ABC subunit A [Bacillus thuringiensis]PFR65801.1 excinuclease ABC subunit A [Bacillus thuringiensis]PFT77400.1 excinuclease ABC subunit A [Bacillus thuringiensis]PFV87955.1 excinuclease ABC subunit A [Bacillus thuringiensis]
MKKRKIKVRGARANNLKNVSLDLDFDSFTVFSGVSGSGKSSLAFDTIFAEGHRRYVDSLSSYARQFLGQIEKPDVDSIEGLTPSVSIEQKVIHKNPRSTVGTVTEIYDYIRILYSTIGIPRCPEHHIPIQPQSIDQMIDKLKDLEDGVELFIYAPLIKGEKGEFKSLINDISQKRFIRVRIDEELIKPSATITLDKNKKHTIEALIDKVTFLKENKRRITDSIKKAAREAKGQVLVEAFKGNEKKESYFFNSLQACPTCGYSIDNLSPRNFSFNSPYGACNECHGLGATLQVNPRLLITDWNKSINDGVFDNWATSTAKWYHNIIDSVCQHYGILKDTPFKDLPLEHRNILLYGSGNEEILFDYQSDRKQRTHTSPFEGVIPNINRRYSASNSTTVKEKLEEVMSSIKCQVCQGKRLKISSLAVFIGNKNISQLSEMSIEELYEYFKGIENLLDNKQLEISSKVLEEISSRLQFLLDVGLEYLTLDREAKTLSGGEAQRIRLATQIGSALSGVIYVLDEPSIGLHQRDNLRLIDTLKRLKELGNMVIVVEHDIDTMLAADYIVELGKGAGKEGGEIVAADTPKGFIKGNSSLTSQYLSGVKKIEIPKVRRKPNGNYLSIVGARENNLKNVNVDIPLGVLTCITGVSGSGKSTLINEILYKHLAREINRAYKLLPGLFDDIKGLNHIDRVINIDQSPIGKSPRSNPATYTGMFDEIRDLFAKTTDAKVRGLLKKAFSFNVPGGRCDTCKGDGVVKIEMHYLPDVYVVCDDCEGNRYTQETLSVQFKNKNISDVLNMTVSDAIEFFKDHPKIMKYLQSLSNVGLGYMKIGQPATTLSGGEAQRIKLATELARSATNKTLYILDEPTTGLHLEDINRILKVLQRLVDKGSSVLVIEHNLDVIKTADYIIDLGPNGGENGGEVVAVGTPEDICQVNSSITGIFLKSVLDLTYN